jgi:protein-S-isoprenylcysteine O-methyltransferase Ste14
MVWQSSLCGQTRAEIRTTTLLTFNWLGLFLIITCTMLAYALRVWVEEKAMLAQFGAKYSEYAAHTKRLVPWIY